MQWEGRNSTGIFFPLHIYSSTKASSFLLLCLDQWTQDDQTNIFFYLETPRGGLLLYFCSEKRPGYVANAPGCYFGNVIWNALGGVYSIPYGTPIRTTTNLAYVEKYTYDKMDVYAIQPVGLDAALV